MKQVSLSSHAKQKVELKDEVYNVWYLLIAGLYQTKF